MSRKKPETELQQAIQRLVRSQGGVCWHPAGSIKQAGQPDLDGAMPVNSSRSVWMHFKVEVKMPGKEADPHQAAWLKVWQDANYITGVVHSVEEFVALFQDYNTVTFTVRRPNSYFDKLWRLFR